MKKLIAHDIKVDEKWMKKALDLALKASMVDEVPVGALVVLDGRVIGRGFNLRESRASPTAHAEIIALEKAARKLGAWRLSGATLYVTLEPCVMCAGALVHSRLARVVYGAHDPKAGGLSSLYQIGGDTRLNHQFEVSGGILANECGQILKDFFRAKRRSRKGND